MDVAARIAKLEKQFSRNDYKGGGSDDFATIEGEIPVMISAPHSVKMLREGEEKGADKLTGAIALLLQEMTGCHLIYSTRYSESDPNYAVENNGYQAALADYVKSHDVQIVIDLHGAKSSREFAVEMGTAPLLDGESKVQGKELRSLKRHTFVADLVRYAFDYHLRDVEVGIRDVWCNRLFSAATQNTITKHLADNTDCAAIQLEINAMFRTIDNAEPLKALVETLCYIVKTLATVDWSAKQIAVRRLWQSNRHKPQDNVALYLSDEANDDFATNSLLYICSHLGITEVVRLHDAKEKPVRDLEALTEGCDVPANVGRKEEYILLTNRLIEELFARDWLVGSETESSLRGAPVVLYDHCSERYKVGYPKADVLDNVCFSSLLYKDKVLEADKYDFIAFNRITDARMYIDFSKADYNDGGRVKSSDGKSAKKVMVPRYYRRLLGYVDTPLAMIREEPFADLLREAEAEASNYLARVYTPSESGFVFAPEVAKGDKFTALLTTLGFDCGLLRDSLSQAEMEALSADLKLRLTSPLQNCYRKLGSEIFYRVDKQVEPQVLAQTIEIQKYLGVDDHIDLLRIPKSTAKPLTLCGRLRECWGRFANKVLENVVGKVECSFRSTWTSETDDKNNVARLSPNMMSLLGVSENDKIVVCYGGKKAVLRVLAGVDMVDYKIGLPAPTRKALKLSGVNVVVAYRDMNHIFKRHSLVQNMALVGLVLAITQITTNLWALLISCAVFLPVSLYFILNEERIKVR